MSFFEKKNETKFFWEKFRKKNFFSIFSILQSHILTQIEFFSDKITILSYKTIFGPAFSLISENLVVQFFSNSKKTVILGQNRPFWIKGRTVPYLDSLSMQFYMYFSHSYFQFYFKTLLTSYSSFLIHLLVVKLPFGLKIMQTMWKRAASIVE